MPTQYTPLANSTYLDYDSYRSSAPAPTGAAPAGNFTFNVALVLDRANDPTALLQSDWASRQQQLEALSDSGTLWSTYGANPASYNQVLSELGALGIPTVNQIDPANGYVSSANRARSGCRSTRAISPRCSARRLWPATTRPATP